MKNYLIILLVVLFIIAYYKNISKKNIENFNDNFLRNDDKLLEIMLNAIGPLTNKNQNNSNYSKMKTIEPTIDIGGWNNIKMAFEIIVCLATKYDRALVIPEKTQWYLVEGSDTHLFDFFDENTFKSFVKTSNVRNNNDEFKFENNCLIKTTSAMNENDFNEFDKISHYKNWKIDSKKCRHFTYYARHFKENKYHNLVNKAFRLRKDIIVEACKLLNKHDLELGKYIAIHIRKGEFQYRDELWGNDTVGRIKSKINKISKNLPILIVSDEYNKQLIDGLSKISPKVVCWSKQKIVNPKIDPIIDMVCCVPAKHFFGTSLSTFSTGIMQWRGYLKSSGNNEIDDNPYFFQDQSFCESCAGDIEPDSWRNISFN